MPMNEPRGVTIAHSFKTNIPLESHRNSHSWNDLCVLHFFGAQPPAQEPWLPEGTKVESETNVAAPICLGRFASINA